MAAWTGFYATDIVKTEDDGQWATHTFDIYEKNGALFFDGMSIIEPSWKDGATLYEAIAKAIAHAYKSEMMNAGKVVA